MESQAASKGMLPTFPQTGPTSIPQWSMVQPYQWKAPLQKFLKGEPKALGTVQIMIALMNFSLGVIIIIFPWESYGPSYFLWYTGYVFWGSPFFIISGSLSIASENRTTSTLVKSSLAMNTVSSVVAGLGITFYSVNLIVIISFYFCYQDNPFGSCNFAQPLVLGFDVFLLILNVLEFAVSLTLSIFGCKPFCCVQSGVTIFTAPPTCVPQDPVAEVCKGGTMLQNPVADTSLPGSHPGNFI
ncbi:membrane-spanning 4-domains subfamily A member 4A-like [Trichosurus vulpecula]|uniref:membrane-spanning 4-domains subfamily A member 4A-like n=1 Tax=Trichosurus vulpecula TaxID=9337 RepID=UPI00186AE26E|nr:membrane-spanning 4-domains subfamily A member 4A-like [Trichosurus vulpecula]